MLHTESPLVHLQMLAAWALAAGLDLPDLDVHRPTLEDVYLSLTGSTTGTEGLTNDPPMARRRHQAGYDLRASSPQPPVPVLHPRPASAVPGDLRIDLRRRRPHRAVAGGRISTSVYYVPGIITLGIIAASFVNLVVSVTAQRERGVLKRRRATPVPASAIIAGRALTAVVIAVVMAAILLGIGWAAFSAHVPGRTALALAVTVIIGAASFCCLGYALTSLVHNEDAALPSTQAILLPLYFISGVFVSVTILPRWLADVANVFPVRHLADALLTAYNPHTAGLGFAGQDLLIVAAWGIAGLLIAIRKFSWLPLSR